MEEAADATNSADDTVVEAGINLGTVENQTYSDCIQPPEEINEQQLGIPIDVSTIRNKLFPNYQFNGMVTSEPANDALNNVSKEEVGIYISIER